MIMATVPPNTPQKNAQKYFATTEKSETVEKKARKKERAANTAKTAHLRELRLAKEASDKEAADKLAETQGDSKRPARRPAQKKRPLLRMTY